MRSLTSGLIIRSSSLPFTLYKRFHFLKPCSSLKQTNKKKQKQSLPPSTAPPPQTLRWLFTPKSSDDEDAKSSTDGDAALKGTILAGVLLIGSVGGFAGVGYVYRDQINTFLSQFSTLIEGYGPAGYALFIAVYAGLEILAIPALPLTMSAGLLFGSLVGTIIVSISGTGVKGHGFNGHGLNRAGHPLKHLCSSPTSSSVTYSQSSWRRKAEFSLPVQITVYQASLELQSWNWW